MGKSLVIVESPAKAKTINKYLGRDFVVKSSVGHIRDLPVSGSGKPVDAKARAAAAAITRKLPPAKREAHKKKKAQIALIARMGIDPAKDWQAHYEILPGKEKVVAQLRRLAENAAGAHPERCQHLRQCAALGGEHDADPHVDDADASVARFRSRVTRNMASTCCRRRGFVV